MRNLDNQKYYITKNRIVEYQNDKAAKNDCDYDDVDHLNFLWLSYLINYLVSFLVFVFHLNLHPLQSEKVYIVDVGQALSSVVNNSVDVLAGLFIFTFEALFPLNIPGDINENVDWGINHIECQNAPG